MADKFKDKKILAIIPARGGSKGLPRKNLKSFAGKPLIAWTIESALKSKHLDKIIVSTDDQEIENASKDAGAEVIERPKELATDDSLVMDAIRHSLKVLKKEIKYTPDIVVILQVTSPLRTTNTIDSAIEIFLKKFDNYDSLISLSQIEGKIGNIENGLYYPNYVLGQGRQKVREMYKECGTVYILKTDLIIKGEDFGNNIHPFIINAREESIDIDTIDDFQEAEYFFKKSKS